MIAAACHSDAYYWANAVGVVGVVAPIAFAAAWAFRALVGR